MKKDYYKEIDKALQCYEEYKPYRIRDIDWICGRIDWCNRWKKIAKEQTDELADRATAILEDDLFIK